MPAQRRPGGPAKTDAHTVAGPASSCQVMGVTAATNDLTERPFGSALSE